MSKSHLTLPGMGEGDTFTDGNLCLAFRHKGGEQRAGCFQLKVAYFGLAYSQLPSLPRSPVQLEWSKRGGGEGRER